MKKRTVLLTNLVLGLCYVLISSGVHAQNTQVTVSDIRSEKGKIVLNVFKDDQGYQSDHPYKQIKFEKKGLEKGSLVLMCTLEPGTYGITVLDDENENGQMDKNFVRMPKEGFGFSNFYLEKLKRPSFDEFKVDIKDLGNKVSIRVKYM